jgi:hypothetical protein
VRGKFGANHVFNLSSGQSLISLGSTVILRRINSRGLHEDHISSARRADEELLTIMDQITKWTVNGRAGCVLRTLPSLREALRAVFEHEATGQPVLAICRQPGDEIILFREQVARLAAADAITTLGLRRHSRNTEKSLCTTPMRALEHDEPVISFVYPPRASMTTPRESVDVSTLRASPDYRHVQRTIHKRSTSA